MTKSSTIQQSIPDFANLEEEAAFWDTHSIVDYTSAMRRVRVRRVKSLAHSFNIRLDSATIERLRSRAQEKGLGPTQLVRMWIMEHLSVGVPGGRTRLKPSA